MYVVFPYVKEGEFLSQMRNIFSITDEFMKMMSFSNFLLYYEV